ncbi:multi-sensor signal transduction histidine kinase [Sphingomonas sp. LH128]|uniref:histidine kinase n=1 Tax=Novosphingobium resinovorum TaxID=158500 RepID=A0A031K2I8_9SPHN|nr:MULTISPECIES: XrtA/PEP-CTERM system histidine kinase PrsK [Sphingomonadaceae]AOR76255.1 histidine kinase [Novosphingobium resinovorum]EJU14243.1 multi-sensor signal transduction histidine kinase [Sphingomonas sp. LH128]EZP83238.1 Multi-sensor signal transduction histidine kinase [Novosphingobium resinovorum]
MMKASAVWATMGVGLDLTGAIALASIAIWLFSRRDRFGAAGTAMVVALLFTALWSLACAFGIGTPEVTFLPALSESARNLAWLVVVYRLFASDGRDASVAPIRPVIFALGAVEILHFAVNSGLSRLEIDRDVLDFAFQFNVMFRLLVTVGGLVLAHNLYAGAPRESRAALRWPAMGLAVLWAFDLNLYTIAYLAGNWPYEIAAIRGVAAIAMAVCIAIGGAKNRNDLRLRPSRAVTFQTFSLLVIGVYLVAMVAVAQWLSYAGGNFARLVELAFLTLGSAFALVVLPSRRVRSWFKVILAKHFFQHRYDYREEWLRFTRTIGSDQSAALGERVVQSMADVFESPAGLLLTPGEHGELTLAARWNWREIEVPAVGLPVQDIAHFERTGYIADLDDVRAGRESGTTIPNWLIDHPRAWALIPLVHYDRLVGMVVLARPQLARKFDWEDFDLLRVIGQQVASYLSENASQLALAESARFEDFNRRIAFVMHDIKNLASQFSLLARNAELHAEKPAFRADMLVTLRNSSDKLNALLARLSRYGSGGVDRVEQVAATEVLGLVMERFKDSPQVVLAESRDIMVTASRHSLEQVLVHLVQNAVDASEPESPVFLSLVVEGINARFEVLDSGTGMSADFVRNRLFKPFVSTKSGGFGIGAFEARELVRAMRGRLDVESREGLGSRFTVRLPLAAATDIYPNYAEKVA